jgi:hypothetical protein
MECAFELVRRDDGRQVEQGAWDRRDRDAADGRGLVGW